MIMSQDLKTCNISINKSQEFSIVTCDCNDAEMISAGLASLLVTT